MADDKKMERFNILNLTVVALVALVAIVGVTAIVLNGHTQTTAQQSTLSAAGQATDSQSQANSLLGDARAGAPCSKTITQTSDGCTATYHCSAGTLTATSHDPESLICQS